MTYQALNTRANQLAHWLIEQGIRPDNRIGIALERSTEWIIAMLGILKAGGAYVPLDPSYPQDRLQYMIEDSQPKLVLTIPSIFSQLGTLPKQVKILDMHTAPDMLADYSQQNIPKATLGLTPEHLVYVIYTSGSTGKPKGVMIQHRNLCSFAHALQQQWQFDGTDRILQFANLGFDFAISDIFGALCHGARLVLRTDAWISSPQSYWEHCEQEGITYSDIPTQFWTTLSRAALPLPKSLKVVCTGGEAVRWTPSNSGWKTIRMSYWRTVTDPQKPPLPRCLSPA
ncbi:AMP-binding protein [Vibrio sp. PP-XX7]